MRLKKGWEIDLGKDKADPGFLVSNKRVIA
jgi:hypothetical protein